MKKILQYSIIVLIITISFLFAPKPPENKGPDRLCPYNYVQLNKSMGFSLNCDAIEYLGLSVTPSVIFQENSRRQSRPLYIFSGSFIGYFIYYISSPIHNRINRIASTPFKDQIPNNKVSLYISHYAGLIFLNFVILLFSLLLFEKIISHFSASLENISILRLSFFFLLLSNNITKTYFWTPHQQMFNILVPLLCLWLFISVIKNQYTDSKIFILNFLCGILLLFYGSFLLLFPILIISVYYKYRFILQRKLWKVILCILLGSIAFFVPLLIWITILKLKGISFYSIETEEFRQLLWVVDALVVDNRSVGKEILENFKTYILTSGSLIFPLAFLILSFAISKKNHEPKIQIKYFYLNLIFAIVSLIIFLFYGLLGYYTDRLTFTLSPVLISYSAILLTGQQISKIKTISMICLIFLWHIFILCNEMPHFSNRFYY